MIRNRQFNIVNNILFVLNVIAGIVLILASLAGKSSPSQNAWIQVFGLIYPIFFIINTVFLIYWVILVSRRVFFTIIILLLGFSNIFDNFQVTIFNAIDKHPDQTSVLSYNVKNFNERNHNTYELATKSSIINFLIEQNADVVCVQEYHSTSNNLYRPLKEIRDTLGAVTYYYESYFNPRYNQLSGLVIFSKYQAVNKGKLKFSGSRTFGIYTDVIINYDTVRIFNIHLASIKLKPEDLDFVVNPDAENSSELKNHSLEIYDKLLQAFDLREKQLKFLIDEIETTKYKTILCGDFNDTPSSWVYNQLANYLVDTFVKKGTGVCRTYAGPIPFLRIDYILTSKEIVTHGFTRHSFEKSDHYPISAIIE